MRIVGAAVDGIVRLPVGEAERDIGLAEDHRARRLEPRDHERVLIRNMVAVLLDAPARDQPRDIERFLDRHRHAEQRRALAGGNFGVGLGGGLARAIEIADDHRVDRRVARLDPRDRRLAFGERAGFSPRDPRRGSDRGGFGESQHLDAFLLLPFPRRRESISQRLLKLRAPEMDSRFRGNDGGVRRGIR